MNPSDRHTVSVYLGPSTLDELAREARRLDRSLSKVVQYAWRAARKRIRALGRHTTRRAA